MGWEDDDIMSHKGIWKLDDSAGIDVGLFGVWWGPPAQPRLVNLWRVHIMPVPVNSRMELTTAYGTITGDNLNQRRAAFQGVYNNYLADPDVGFDPTHPDVRAREWTGFMKESSGGAGAGGSSSYPDTEDGTRDPGDQI